MGEVSARKIERISYLIHPYCWSSYPGIPEGRDPELWNASLVREIRNHRDHLQFISSLGPAEALVIYPIGESAPMAAVIEHARRFLGPRCHVITWRVANPAPLVAGVQDPIRRWLDTEDPLLGKEQYVRDNFSDFGARPTRQDVAQEVEEEIRQACLVIGYDWSPAALKVIYYNRAVALEIEEAFRGQGLAYDPRALAGLAFGEGFAACAMTWKSMIPSYLGLALPIENDFDLSTEGLGFLNDARLRERLDLGGDLRLFLIEGPERLPVAIFRARAGPPGRALPLCAHPGWRRACPADQGSLAAGQRHAVSPAPGGRAPAGSSAHRPAPGPGGPLPAGAGHGLRRVRNGGGPGGDRAWSRGLESIAARYVASATRRPHWAGPARPPLGCRRGARPKEADATTGLPTRGTRLRAATDARKPTRGEDGATHGQTAGTCRRTGRGPKPCRPGAADSRYAANTKRNPPAAQGVALCGYWLRR